MSDNTPTAKPYAQHAYEAYCNFTGWKSAVSGAPLPQWDDVRQDIQDAWRIAALAVINAQAKQGLTSDHPRLP